MATKNNPVPAGYHSLTPMLTVPEVDKALDYYERALGAEERSRFLGLDGKSIMHAELRIGDSVVMLGGEQPEKGCRSPQTLGGTPVSLYLYVEDADQAFHRATSAGARVAMPVGEMFWGDRCGTFVDPFGHQWTVATRKADLSQEDIQKRGEAFFAQMAKK
ncbi:MAG TPA: VOC family protein [Nitrospiraceae bacterium]|nr:VOC family protein [Nitrospiraceae bacterium]